MDTSPVQFLAIQVRKCTITLDQVPEKWRDEVETLLGGIKEV